MRRQVEQITRPKTSPMVFAGGFHCSKIDLRIFRAETTDIGRFFGLKWTTVVFLIESDSEVLPERNDDNRKSSFSCRWKWWFEVWTFPSGCSAGSLPKSVEFRHLLSGLDYPSKNKRFGRSESSSDKFCFAERWAKKISSMRCENLGRRTSKYASRANWRKFPTSSRSSFSFRYDFAWLKYWVIW